MHLSNLLWGRWQTVTHLFVFIAVAGFFYSKTWYSFYQNWTQQDFSHGALILPISLWLTWQLKERLIQVEGSPNVAGFIPFLLGMLIWVIGFVTTTTSVAQTGMVMIMVSGIAAIVGLKRSAILWFPLTFLFLALPFLGWASAPLANWTADALRLLLDFSGIPAFREGNEFVLPTGRWSVVEACSGLRYLIATLVLSVLCAYQSFVTARASLLFIGFSLLLSVVSNWFRAFLTVITGHLTHMKFGPGPEHMWLGWILFGIMFVFLLSTVPFWKRFDVPKQTKFGSDLKRFVVSTISKFDVQSKLYFPILIAALVLPPIYLANLYSTGQKSPESSELSNSKPVEKLQYEPALVGAQKTYRSFKSKTEISFLVASFYNQPVNGAMLNLANRIQPDEEHSEWRSGALGIRTFQLDEKSTLLVNSMLINKASEAYEVLYWYKVGSDHILSGSQGKLSALKNILSGAGDDSTLNMVLIPLDQKSNSNHAASLLETLNKVQQKSNQFINSR